MRPRLLLALLLALPLVATAAAQTRVALVIGNAGYQSLKPLDNPGKDAAAVAERLAGLGFTLIGADGKPTQGPVLNLGSDAFLIAVREFAKIARGAEIAFVYYAGHGLQIGGNPYLVPDRKLDFSRGAYSRRPENPVRSSPAGGRIAPGERRLMVPGANG